MYRPFEIIPEATAKLRDKVYIFETDQQRDIEVEELSSFDEVIACGTAVVVTPIGSLTRFDENDVETKFQFSEDVGATTRRLYDTVRNIQNGEIEDKFGWNYKVQ